MHKKKKKKNKNYFNNRKIREIKSFKITKFKIRI